MFTNCHNFVTIYIRFKNVECHIFTQFQNKVLILIIQRMSYFLIQKQYTTIYEHILEDILNTTYISVYWYCKYLFQVGVNVDFCLAKRQIQIYTVLL